MAQLTLRKKDVHRKFRSAAELLSTRYFNPKYMTRTRETGRLRQDVMIFGKNLEKVDQLVHLETTFTLEVNKHYKCER